MVAACHPLRYITSNHILESGMKIQGQSVTSYIIPVGLSNWFEDCDWMP